MKLRKFRDRLREELKNPEFKKVFDEEDVYARLAVQIAKLREDQGLSQKDLAKRLHTSQQMISRLEDPGNRSLSIQTLVKLAQALHKKIEIGFLGD
ncbi:MAG: helix-turn-helix transcriptional regulator [Candidatus Omnitrophica bacterium]|nr:helix-turn-helix transcriptional regulator [Candidatus Omnitrophota bacterium]